MESEIWATFQASRGANATLFLAMVVAIWVAARFCSVMVEKEAPLSAKIICSVFSLSVFAMNWIIATNMANQLIGHANAMASLGESASPMAKGFAAQYGGEMATMPHPVAIALLVSGFLIAFLPLWMSPKK
ncbi:MAG: hypothetical protein HN523_08795 [Porticoccaceae bacterium]|jgi:hypothetical protein|nr:hypothetical protein [Porticoccaceae bacterium]